MCPPEPDHPTFFTVAACTLAVTAIMTPILGPWIWLVTAGGLFATHRHLQRIQ
jgi:hypothetical protein